MERRSCLHGSRLWLREHSADARGENDHEEPYDDEEISFHSDVLSNSYIAIDTYELLPPTPLHRITGVAENRPVETPVLAVTGVALQRAFRRLHHVGGRPVHIGCGKSILPAVLQSGDGCRQLEGVIPIEVRPEAILTRSDRLEKIVVHDVV